jgi:hypothetical protein
MVYPSRHASYRFVAGQLVATLDATSKGADR